jgi:gliding motility-associated protein GldM
MSGQNETPRQKMIGMMYLILTALLALNVSKDVLDAFIVVNSGLENTNDNFSKKNEELYAEFNLAKSVDPVRVNPNWQKAQHVKKESQELINYIDKLSKKLIAQTDGIPENIADTIQLAYLNSKDNYDIPTNILIGNSEDGSNGESRILKNKLNDYKQLLTDYILPNDRKKVVIDINTNDPPKNDNNENWETYNFYHRPLVASITILSKLKNDIKNAESTTVNYLLKQVDEGNLKFDTVAAKVIPQSNYVLLGEDYKADLFLAAFNKTKNPEILIGNYNAKTNSFGGTPVKLNVDKGLGKYVVKTTREGIVSYSGTIKMTAPSGKEILFPFESEYIVAKPALTVSADNMNVFYIGLENPVSVSVPGMPNEKLSVSIDNGKITPKGNGKYSVTMPLGVTQANINVVATMENGEKRSMGSMPFRVKRIPKPTLKFAGLTTDGSLTKGEIESNLGLIASADNFEFAVNFKVTSFDVSVVSGGTAETISQNGNSFDQTIKTRFGRLKRGDKVSFENVYVMGPDGQSVKINGLTVRVR